MKYRTAAPVVLLLVALATLSACDEGEVAEEPTSTSPSSLTVSAEKNEAPPPQLAHLTFSGEPEMGIEVSDSTTASDDGTRGLIVVSTIEAPVPATAGFQVQVTVQAGARVAGQPDQSVAVVDSAGVLIGGLAAPTVLDAGGQTHHGIWAVDESMAPTFMLTYSELPAEIMYPLTVTIHTGSRAIDTLTWGNREGGKSLAVVPTAWGREAGLVGRDFGFTEAVRAIPEVDTNVMRDQYQCHYDGARQKAQWNLEPWRPDVGYLKYVLAKCNPTS